MSKKCNNLPFCSANDTQCCLRNCVLSSGNLYINAISLSDECSGLKRVIFEIVNIPSSALFLGFTIVTLTFATVSDRGMLAPVSVIIDCLLVYFNSNQKFSP